MLLNNEHEIFRELILAKGQVQKEFKVNVNHLKYKVSKIPHEHPRAKLY